MILSLILDLPDQTKACLSKIFENSPQSIDQGKETIASIIMDSNYLLSKNPNPAKILKIKL